MKAFILSLILTLCVIIFAVIGAGNIVSICDNMINSASMISYSSISDKDEALKKAEELQKYWEDKEFYISAFAGHTQTNETADALGAMRESIASEDIGSYCIFKNKLIDSIQNIREAQTLSFDSII